jgi:hypothetical protein
MRGVDGKPGWFWLFLLEGLLTFVIGLVVSTALISRKGPLLTQTHQSFLYLPTSPTSTKSILCRRQWYTEREEIIMINVSFLQSNAVSLSNPL